MSQIVKIQNRVFSSPSSIYTREDVLNLLKDLELLQNAEAEAEKAKAAQTQLEWTEAPAPVNPNATFTEDYVLDQLESLQEEIMDEIRSFDYSDMVDLSMDGREIVVDFDSSYIEDAVERVFKQYVMTLSSQKA
jgi:hypothetical protein